MELIDILLEVGVFVLEFDADLVLDGLQLRQLEGPGAVLAPLGNSRSHVLQFFALHIALHQPVAHCIRQVDEQGVLPIHDSLDQVLQFAQCRIFANGLAGVCIRAAVHCE